MARNGQYLGKKFSRCRKAGKLPVKVSVPRMSRCSKSVAVLGLTFVLALALWCLAGAGVVQDDGFKTCAGTLNRTGQT